MTITIQPTQETAAAAQADAVVVGVVQGPTGPLPAPGADDVDAALGSRLAALLAALGATGKPEEISKIPAGDALAAPLVIAVGLGPDGRDAPRFDLDELRRAAGAAMRAWSAQRAPARSQQHGTDAAGTQADDGKRRIVVALPVGDAAEAEAVALGALLGGYTFRRYRAASAHPDEAKVDIALCAAAELAPAVRRAEVLADAVTLARDLVNTAPADLTPADFAARAERVAADSGLDVRVLEEKELIDGGYGGIVGVGKGSIHPPRLVRLGYAHPEARRTVVLAGKGITFDSGGLSLKPPKSMETMKSDMGGAAAVLGAMRAIAALRPAVNVVGYLPLAENMPGGAAQRPSDVLTIHGGKTVEVLNTDAEGRLVLADALAACATDSPDLVVDVATLTGAQLVALGRRVAGVMASDDELAAAVAAAAHRAGEAAWPMPLPEELRKSLDSTVADIANVSPDHNAGMLVAGVFLREFVPAGTRWAHFDIAGPAFNDSEAFGYTPKGGTGAATRALVQLACDVADATLAVG